MILEWNQIAARYLFAQLNRMCDTAQSNQIIIHMKEAKTK